MPRLKRYKNHFCSIECTHSFLRKKVKIVCDYCGKEALVWPSQKKKSKNHFCSQECHSAFTSLSNVNKSIGIKYGQLTVLSFAYVKREAYVNCECDCGNKCIKMLRSVKSGNTVRCGNCSDEFRFMKYVKVIDDNVWIWNGSKLKKGYGYFRYNERNQLAHRVSYQLFVGEIPKGMCVCHKDDNPSNISPNNLWLGTHQDNMKDMIEKGRDRKAKGKNHYKRKF